MAPDATGFALFATTIGCCGIVWRGGAVRGVQLPEASEAATRARLGALFPEAREAAPPDRVARAIDGIVALLEGRAVDLTGVDLDMEGVPPFHRKVYAVVRAIPPGSTLTYGDVAARAGSPGSARAVGQAMAKNPFAPVVPCHRVLAAGGKAGGFSANGGVTTKREMLAIEGAPGAQPALPFAASPHPVRPGEAIDRPRAEDPTPHR
jgi:methylated-DNA-[protein]-cysteine S-methyltransferase